MRVWLLVLVLAVLGTGSSARAALTCRSYRGSEATSGYTLPWISGIARTVTAGACSPSNPYHSTSAVWLYNINDATFAYDFRMRYEPVCTMASGWMIEFRDDQPDLAGTNLSGSSNFMKILTPANRVDYYTHLRKSWWTETGQPEFKYMDRKRKIMNLNSAQGKLKWVRLTDGRYRLVNANGTSITFNQMMSLGAQGYLDDIFVPQAHCIAYSGSSGTTAPHLHVESRCSLTDSQTCPLEFGNAVRVLSSGATTPEYGVLREGAVYLAK